MQRVLVTGANRGLGLEFVQQLLARGARVIAACRQPGRALKLTELAAAHPGHLHVLPLDLSKERSIAGLAHEAGMLTDRLDALINNAGVLVSGERYGELAAKPFAETFATNVIGPLLLTQVLTPLLENGEGARIVNLSSDLGSHADTVAFNTPSYAISKAALNMVTRLTAAELGARGITVISLNPGWVRTDMGGARAPLAVNESVAAMLEVIDGLKPGDGGRFLDYSGADVAW
ncbi:MAG TPA: SDR family oxidoreductase [Rudaea sp.]|jgi:NAD(P)-dependent dehydrogenase (short-subunit alcohol dehydrogenase family)|nr:SDR family oxidoreductase [Rudaea sp.]